MVKHPAEFTVHTPTGPVHWCQRCHLHYDRHHHAANSYATRKAKLNNLELAL